MSLVHPDTLNFYLYLQDLDLYTYLDLSHLDYFHILKVEKKVVPETSVSWDLKTSVSWEYGSYLLSYLIYAKHVRT